MALCSVDCGVKGGGAIVVVSASSGWRGWPWPLGGGPSRRGLEAWLVTELPLGGSRFVGGAGGAARSLELVAAAWWMAGLYHPLELVVALCAVPPSQPRHHDLCHQQPVPRRERANSISPSLQRPSVLQRRPIPHSNRPIHRHAAVAAHSSCAIDHATYRLRVPCYSPPSPALALLPCHPLSSTPYQPLLPQMRQHDRLALLAPHPRAKSLRDEQFDPDRVSAGNVSIAPVASRRQVPLPHSAGANRP